MGVVETFLGLSVVLLGRFLFQVAAIVVGLFIWERWLKQRA